MNSDMMERQGLDAISLFLLNVIHNTLDIHGAWEWNLRLVGMIAAVFLGVIKVTMKKSFGIDWFSFANAIITGLGAIAVVYLNVYASETMTGIPGMLSLPSYTIIFISNPILLSVENHGLFLLLSSFLPSPPFSQNHFGQLNVPHL